MTNKNSSKIIHRVYMGDPRDMAAAEDGSSSLVVTTLPYPDEILEEGAGQFDFAAYVLDLALVWKECQRALAPGGRLCVHMSGGAGKYFKDTKGRPRAAVEAMYSSAHAAGFEFDVRIIWHREAVKGLELPLPGASALPREICMKGEADCIMIFRKPGESPEAPKGAKQKSRLSKKEAGRLGSVMWSFPGQLGKSFPDEVPKRLIKLYSYVGETVLDPFAGGGEVCAAARDLGRSSLAYSFEEDREEEIREKLEAGHGAKNFTVEKAAADEKKIEKLAAELGEILSAKVEGVGHRRPAVAGSKRRPRKKKPQKQKPQAGGQEKDTINVVQVFNVNHVRDDRGRDVKLLGIDVPDGFFSRNLGVYRQSMDFVKRTTEGKTLRVKSSDGKFNSVYLFEDGEKVSINEKLVKSGYALSDRNADHELRKRFDKLEKEASDHAMGMWAMKKTDSPR